MAVTNRFLKHDWPNYFELTQNRYVHIYFTQLAFEPLQKSPNFESVQPQKQQEGWTMLIPPEPLPKIPNSEPK